MNLTTPSRPLLSIVCALGLLAAACGNNDAELEALQTSSAEAISELEATVAERDTQLTERDTTIAGLETELGEATTAVSTLEAELVTAGETLAGVEAERDAANDRADEAEAREQELLNTYDAEIRADAQAAWDTEVAAACAEAGDGTEPILSYVTHTDQLAVIGTRIELVEAVNACAQPLRDRSEEEKLDAECTTGDPDALLRGTAEFVGDCLVVHVVPFQWDSRTGACNFLARWDGANLGTRSFRYDGTGLFRAGSSVCTNDLDGADQDDLLKVWVEVVGTYNYDTAAGGTNAVPEFTIVKAVLVSKA